MKRRISGEWRRPHKTQTKSQWSYIARIALVGGRSDGCRYRSSLGPPVNAVWVHLHSDTDCSGRRTSGRLTELTNEVTEYVTGTRWKPTSLFRLELGGIGTLANLSASSLSATSQEVIEADSRYITEKGLLGAGQPGSGLWPVGRARRGLVMGAVQSGKNRVDDGCGSTKP